MKTIVEEKQISFKELEQKIFSYVCELGREITTAMLEAYDKELAEGRDKKNYRDNIVVQLSRQKSKVFIMN